MNQLRLLLSVWIAMFIGVTNLAAHEGPHEGKGTAGVSQRTQSITLPSIEGTARPWSAQPVLNDEDRFHFAVVTDRTGGHRPGIWMQAVRNLNLLRPEFVVSVGDLIEGYTENEAQVESEWKEFLGFIEELEMKFFFVAGNHDVTNPMMHDIWRKHFGKEWYSFDYKNVHFVCLLSENPSAHLGEEQLKWAIQDLKDHQDARWTFVFLHKPLWVYAERELAAGNPDPTNWKKLERALGTRSHTVLAGHVHHYVQFERNGQEYYQLATTGGGSQLRGQGYGEFDHFVWITMEHDGPRIANVLLNGVLAPDVVTEQGIARFRRFLQEARIFVSPVLVEASDQVEAAEIRMTFTNEFDETIDFQGRLSGLPLQGLTLSQNKVELTVPPHDTRTVVSRFELSEPLDVALFQSVSLTTTVRSGDLSAEITAPVTIDRRYEIPAAAIALDGKLNDWKGRSFQFTEAPALLGPAGQWQGLDEGSLEFRVARDDEMLYFGGVVTDDKLVPGRDRLYFSIDARAMEQRAPHSRLGEHCYTIELHPNATGDAAEVVVRTPRGSQQKPAVEAQVQQAERGYSFEIAVPLSVLVDSQGTDWDSFQLNAALRDVDEETDSNLYLLWRNSPDVTRTNTNFAHFFRKGK